MSCCIPFVKTKVTLVTGYFTSSKVMQYKQQAIQKTQETEITQSYIIKMSDTIDKILDITRLK